MSAPTPAPGDDRPREGYYPDPSIPGYVRYWNGASWVPGTSRPAPADGSPLSPPPGARPAAPAVEETGPHFFDEDPGPGTGAGGQASGWGDQGDARLGQHAPHGPYERPGSGADPRAAAQGPAQPAGHAARTDGTASIPPTDDDGPDPGGTFIFRRPVPGPAAVRDDAAPPFGPAPGHGRPGGEAGAAAPGGQPSVPAGAGGFAAQGPGGASPAGAAPGGPGAAGPGAQGPGGAPGQSPAAAGPGFGAGKAAAARAAAAQTPQAAPSAVAPGVPQQTAPPQGGQQGGPLGGPQQVPAPGTPLTSGPGGGQSSWAQQVHRLAGGADEQPVAPWKPPVEDVFQAAARRQAAARPAGLGRRLAARLVDSLVIGAVTAAAAVPLGTRAVDHVQRKIDEARLSGRTVTVWLIDGTTGTSLAVVLGVLLVFGVLYEVLPTARWGRTLGKKLCGLEVRDIEAHEPPGFGAALRRWLVYSVPGLLGIGIVGVLWCLFDRPWRQCWHDKAAHTFVAD